VLHLFRRNLIEAVLPRLLLAIFRFSQPVLINQAIRYVTQKTLDHEASNRGAWIIFAAVVIYVGRAVRATPPDRQAAYM
jgi:ATP-binding cassette, subfamily C (CFTR/MRP), member 1